MSERVNRWGEVEPEPHEPLTGVPVGERVVYLVMIPLLLLFPALWIPPLGYLITVRRTPAGPGAARALVMSFWAAGSLAVLLFLPALTGQAVLANLLYLGVVAWACVFVWHALRRF